MHRQQTNRSFYEDQDTCWTANDNWRGTSSSNINTSQFTPIQHKKAHSCGLCLLCILYRPRLSPTISRINQTIVSQECRTKHDKQVYEAFWHSFSQHEWIKLRMWFVICGPWREALKERGCGKCQCDLTTAWVIDSGICEAFTIVINSHVHLKVSISMHPKHLCEYVYECIRQFNIHILVNQYFDSPTVICHRAYVM